MNRRRIKELKQRMEALVIAIPREESSYHFYMELAEASEREGARQMFIELAQQEITHREKLEKYLEELNKELNELKGKGE